MSLNVCAKLCKECPFSNESINGWLAEYSIDDISEMQNQEILFPCHMMMEEGDLTVAEVQESIKRGEMKLCRGYVESIVKSCKMPRYNKTLIEARAFVKEQGLSENSMSIWAFKKHHETFTNENE